ncbi:MAG: hypothetical protein ABSA42_09725 [Terracidiphilus sp.]|jgi:hypothetical protein
MKLHGTDWAAMTVIAGAGCVAIYAGLERAMRRAVRERQRDTERQLNAMATTVKALQSRVAELGRLQAARGDVVVMATPAESGARAKQAQTKPEIVAALTAAATAFLGKKARVRSAQLLPSAQQDSAGAWAQQGRVIVQTSHNLRQ